MNKLVLGIDATNLRQGGGRTHLIEFLSVATPGDSGFCRVIIWGAEDTLNLIEDRPWLKKRCPLPKGANLIIRAAWQRFFLSTAARREKCDVLFVPGGAYAGSFGPVVSLSQNLLPFESAELARYRLSLLTLKFWILRHVQAQTFRKSNGVIFLTKYAKASVEKVTGKIEAPVAIIPHGLSERFLNQSEKDFVRKVRGSDPIRLIYVSSIEPYKHQWNVVAAVAKVRQETNKNFKLHLAGPANPSALLKLQAAIEKYDPKRKWVHYHGPIDYEKLPQFYHNSDIGIFASTCENLPITLLEKMAIGVPVFSSNRGPMPEVLGDSGFYFDPDRPESLASSLIDLIHSPEKGQFSSIQSRERAKKFNWEACSKKTFDFLAYVATSRLDDKNSAFFDS